MLSQIVKCAFGFRSFNDPKMCPFICGVGVREGARPPSAPLCRGPCQGAKRDMLELREQQRYRRVLSLL